MKYSEIEVKKILKAADGLSEECSLICYFLLREKHVEANKYQLSNLLHLKGFGLR